MNILEEIRANDELQNKLVKYFDIEIYKEDKILEDNNGKIKWNINGMAFGQDASGGEYVLLEDNSIGFNSSEGDTGRIAENINDLFELLINCSNWMDYLYTDLYKDKNLMKKYINYFNDKYFNKIYKEDYQKIKEEMAKNIKIKLYEDIIFVLEKFYKSANRNEKYYYTFYENDGTNFDSDGSIICGELNKHIIKQMGL
jgi:hypothetical protein